MSGCLESGRRINNVKRHKDLPLLFLLAHAERLGNPNWGSFTTTLCGINVLQQLLQILTDFDNFASN